MKTRSLLGLALLLLATGVSARELPGLPLRLDVGNRLDAADCAPASSQIDLSINNVRARIMNGGDMWWDLVGTARYEVPKGSGVNSLFAGAVWIGGIDQNNQLKIAAQTYRQTGNDFFPGPLDGPNGTTDQSVCNDFDKHWQVFGAEIDALIEDWNTLNPNPGMSNPIPVDQIAANILQWPAKGNPYNPVVGQRNLAQFYDRDGDGLYDPTTGDYPIIGYSVKCSTNVYADQMIWWVYNDNGNIHSETGGEPIGMEIHALAFAFRTADEVDNMTFYKYRLLNKSSNTINNCFMGKWVDPDLGCYTDDYIGCNIERGLGIVYNADPIDEPCGSGGSYGNQPPLVGIDYFQGPLDEHGEELGMSYFLYYNNDFTVTGNPENTSDFYGYLSGKWKDGTPFTYGGTAYGGTTPTCYVFPDEPSTTTGWSECSQQNTAADRRIVQSSGPFKLLPGASNDIVVGVVWVRPPVGTYAPCPTFTLLFRADEKAQALFDNCFRILEGPPPPDARLIELDRKLILAIEGYSATESYVQADPVLRAQGEPDSLYRFEGYQIYQLKNANVTLQELDDPTRAQLIYQVDIKNGVTKLINFYYDANMGLDVPTLEVDGKDEGLRHTFEITSNAFAISANKNLVNHQTYYFAVLPYAYNNAPEQKMRYLSSRSVRILAGIPHITEPEFGGLVLNSEYGDGPRITRQEGKGNGGLAVTLTPESVNDILANTFEPIITYERGKGPVNITVYDPKSVRSAEFELQLRDSTLTGTQTVLSPNAYWVLRVLGTNEEIESEYPLSAGNEQLLPDWGLSVFVEQVNNPTLYSEEQFIIDASLTFAEPHRPWLSGVPDVDAHPILNWILSGTFATDNPDLNTTTDWNNGGDPALFEDPTQQYELILDGAIAPYRMVSQNLYYGPGMSLPSRSNNTIADLPSIDLVFTPDKSKWTRCVVIEAGPVASLNEGNRPKGTVRKGRSVDKNGVPSADPNDTGFGWFPGYAIDPESGKRLNIMFAEDSWLSGQNGRDMIWNPTSNLVTGNGEWVMGGRHYIYVMKTEYDEGAYAYSQLNIDLTSPIPFLNTYRNVGWVAYPLLQGDAQYKSMAEGLIPNEATVRVRVQHAYEKFQAGPVVNNTLPRYTFSTADLAAQKGVFETAKNALDTIKVVPNPYYAYSNYERTALENIVKIVNLPPRCIISIYSLDGTLIRRYNRDDNSITSLEWDLKNTAGVPIASGIYIVHVNAFDLGEKTVKWFGVMRPTDLNSF